jgi:thymidylate kinase
VISAEWCAFTNFPWGRGLINFEPQEEHLALETYRTWARLFELQRYYSWIVDRFHISTQTYQSRKYSKRYDFEWLEDRLRPLGFRLVFCTRTPESFAAAREQRLSVSGNPSQYDNLQVFVDEQESMRELVGKSTLPVLALDISDSSVANAAENIADWLEQTGGLYLSAPG